MPAATKKTRASKPTRNDKRVTPPLVKKTNPDIYRFIDFFVKSGERIRGTKPTITRGKDGKLVSYALKKLPESKLEMLALWFFCCKPTLQPTIGAMLSNAVLSELMDEMNRPTFWKAVSELTDRYYPRTTHVRTWTPFSHTDITSMKESLASAMRRMK